mmetsp:Transcript_25595/g.59055  ORF Transcript_25595/g.59055 Transcript_25595/m.59055 type:complete len:117 (-) Transcript_25595:691-1041(-)
MNNGKSCRIFLRSLKRLNHSGACRNSLDDLARRPLFHFLSQNISERHTNLPYHKSSSAKFSSQPSARSDTSCEESETVPVTFISRDGSSSTTIDAPLGADLMTVAIDNDIDIEGEP